MINHTTNHNRRYPCARPAKARSLAVAARYASTYRFMASWSAWMIAMIFLTACQTTSYTNEPTVSLQRDDNAGQLTVLIDGQPSITWQYGQDLDLAHYYPVRGPSGRSMTVQRTEPFPHHRSFWVGDRVRTEDGRTLDTYNAWYSKPEDQPAGPFAQRVRQVRFDQLQTRANQALIESTLLWEFADDQPVLEEHRTCRITALGDREYLVDLTFTLTPSRGEVTFISDAVHYAWPYIRMNEAYNVEHGGGRIVSAAGGINQEATNDQRARWVDYTNEVEGQTEGLAIFTLPDGQPPKWLTRDYGCFGPRRPDAQSGKPFTLEPGQSISHRIAVLVHRGDTTTGRVARHYQTWADSIRDEGKSP